MDRYILTIDVEIEAETLEQAINTAEDYLSRGASTIQIIQSTGELERSDEEIELEG